VTAPLVVNCPICSAPVEWTPESRWRPFCSQRCRTIDLGAWASEAYRIPLTEPADSEADSGEPPDDRRDRSKSA